MKTLTDLAGRWVVPEFWSSPEELRDGTRVTLRYARPSDEEMIRATFATLTPETIYSRFFMVKTFLTRADIDRVTHCDYAHTITLVVAVPSGEGERLIGGGSYSVFEDREHFRHAEVAFVVHQDFQGKGLGTILMRHLVGIARTHGVDQFEAEVLSGNAAMLGVFRNCGLPATFRPEGSVTHVTIALR